MAMRSGQANFSKGVISDELVARIDVAAYASGLRRADNVILLKYGGVTKRPGTRLVAEVYADQGVRLLPFQFSLAQTYVLEMGQGYMRPAAGGGLVLEERLAITAITRGVTTTIAAAWHDYHVGDQVYFDEIAGTTELNGRIGRVTAVGDSGHFTVDVESTGFGAFTGDSGGTTRSATPPPPPPPPPVPPPAPTPPPPPVGGGGGGGSYCVDDDTPILLANGEEIAARFLKVGTMLRTRHETSLEWGDWPVTAIGFAYDPVWRSEIGGTAIRATRDHRFWIDGAWVRMGEIGCPDGKAWVARITVAGAHSYVSAGILSHNIKERMPDE
ncbi:MAG: Phage protein [Sphingomonas bacterium]|uniref:hypothetical protein n=1 Tax=Sphingomonas bacterium TaxID=1895847 RepID=UPI00262AA8D5|nr:hypothetical protein [Sphingomonas bacterium]MDB5710880.1 Phage protein [Sphingomonas bacterium]